MEDMWPKLLRQQITVAPTALYESLSRTQQQRCTPTLKTCMRKMVTKIHLNLSLLETQDVYTTNEKCLLHTRFHSESLITGLFLVFFWVFFWQWGGCNGRTVRFCRGVGGWILGLWGPVTYWLTRGRGLWGTYLLLNVGCFCLVRLPLAVHLVLLHRRPFICAQATLVLNLLQLQKRLDVFGGCGIAEWFLVSQTGILGRVDSLTFLADVSDIHRRLSGTAVVHRVDQRLETIYGFTILRVLGHICFWIGELDTHVLDGLRWNL